MPPHKDRFTPEQRRLGRQAASRRYYLKTSAKKAAYARQWQKDHPEQVRAYRKTPTARAKKVAANSIYNAAHPERRRATVQRWKAANIEHLQAYEAERYQADPGKHRQKTRDYAAAHPEQIRLATGRRRTRKLALPHTWTVEQRAFMRQYWGYACVVCGNEEGFLWTLADDHWLPVASSDCPGTVATNMLPLCHGRGGCNNNKRDHDPHLWLTRRVGARKAKKILAAIAVYFAIVAERFPSPV